VQTVSTGLQPISAEVFALLEQLIDLPLAERNNRLEAPKSRDPALHARVLPLLQAADDAEEGGFLDAPRPPLAAGDTLGTYQLDVALGEGGMGQVWRAHRADGAYETPVALKVLHAHLARGTLRERFAREGRILGALAHVHIARLLDAGVSKRRESFLVLEYIDGQRIDEWCDARRLDVKARVAIFLQICEAVTYAHAHMVVHRDLKPSNILVTQDGVVKLLDFGIAKLLTSEATLPTHDTQLTRVGERLLTPEYAAPEQLRGEAVTSAADVYALGVLLFELLSGAKPYRPTGPAAVDLEHEILRTIPQLPSQATTGAGNLSGRAADRRELRRELRGDLDAIVARAMAKIPTERYAGVHALAEDLRRYLRHEPVMARHLTRRYVFGRFVRRHWLSASVGSAALVLLVLGSAAIAWQARLARIEAHKANAVKDFLLDIFHQNSLDNPDPEKARQTTAQQLLDISSTKMLNSLRDAPQVRDELLDTLTELYDQLELYDKAEPLARARLADLSSGRAGDAATLAAAKLQVGRNSYMRGHFDEAVPQLQGALAILDRIGDRTSANRAQILLELGRSGYDSSPANDPQPKLELEEASALYERCCSQNPDRFEVVQMLARMAERDGQFAEADRLYRRFLELTQLPEFRRSSPDREGAAHDDYGSFLLLRHRYGEAELNMRKAVEISSRTLGPNAPETAGAMGWLGVVLVAVNQAAQGDAMLKEAVASQERSQGPDHIGWTVPTRSRAAMVQLQRGAIGEADASLTRNRAALHLDDARGLASCPWQCPKVLGLSALVAQAQGRFDAAAELLDRCEQVQTRLQGTRNETFGRNSVARAALERLQGRTAAAAEHLAQIVERWPASADELPEPYVIAQLELIELALPQDVHEAETRASALLERLTSLPYHDYVADWEARAQRLAGLALLQEGKPAEAGAHLRRAVQLREAMDVDNSPWLAESRVDLSAALLAERKMADVGALLAAARSAYAAQPALGPQFTEPLRSTWRQFTANKRAR
jgi:serine/threonine protein kinase/Tfp pilus assembly protein PilF